MPRYVRLSDRIRLAFAGVMLEGALDFAPEAPALFLTDRHSGETEVLSINLHAEGCMPNLGEVFVKDWSEHHGLAAALVNTGLARITGSVLVGPFSGRAYRVAISRPSAWA